MKCTTVPSRICLKIISDAGMTYHGRSLLYPRRIFDFCCSYDLDLYDYVQTWTHIPSRYTRCVKMNFLCQWLSKVIVLYTVSQKKLSRFVFVATSSNFYIFR